MKCLFNPCCAEYILGKIEKGDIEIYFYNYPMRFNHFLGEDAYLVYLGYHGETINLAFPEYS